MKILYGVQGTGNGHTTRARMMARHFKAAGIEVDYVFSGRATDQYFGMGCFGDYRALRGLTFATENGAVNYWRTVYQAHPLEFLRDVFALDAGDYDAVLTDFEPISAWAGMRAGVPVIGMGHQYAFAYPDVPRAGDNWQSRLVMRTFAPASIKLGLHWDSFGGPVLPPIIDTSLRHQPADHVLVYLPFEDADAVTAMLNEIGDHKFVQYGGVDHDIIGNVTRKPASVAGFHHDLTTANRVICNCGFELVSECLHLGVPVLTRPLAGQSEQLANAAALRALGFATILQDIDSGEIDVWLRSAPSAPELQFPDVAAAIVGWISRRRWHDVGSLAEQLWPPGKAGGAGLRLVA